MGLNSWVFAQEGGISYSCFDLAEIEYNYHTELLMNHFARGEYSSRDMEKQRKELMVRRDAFLVKCQDTAGVSTTQPTANVQRGPASISPSRAPASIFSPGQFQGLAEDSTVVRWNQEGVWHNLGGGEDFDRDHNCNYESEEDHLMDHVSVGN